MVVGAAWNQLNNAKWRVLNDLGGGGSSEAVVATAVASADYQPTN